MQSRRKIFGSALAILLAITTSGLAWQTPKARDIAVSTNGMNYPAMGVTVQSALEWFDDNMLTSAEGLISAATLNARLSSTSTNTLGIVNVAAAPTNAIVQVGKFYGFKASLTNGATFHITTNTLAPVKILTETNLYNPQTWYSGGSTSTFTPLITGFYWIGAEVRSYTNCQFQIVSTSTGQTVYVGDSSSSNSFVSGGGIVYAQGTTAESFWLEGFPTLGATSAPVYRAVFQAHYLGGN